MTDGAGSICWVSAEIQDRTTSGKADQLKAAAYYNRVRTHLSFPTTRRLFVLFDGFGTIAPRQILDGPHHRYCRMLDFGLDRSVTRAAHNFRRGLGLALS